MDHALSHWLFRGAVVATLAGVSTAVSGQAFVGTTPLPTLTLPDSPASDGREAEATVEAAPDRPEASVLQRLPARAQGWRIEGGGGQLEWPIYVPAGRERGETRIRVAYRSDISLLPASSPLTVAINGRVVGTVAEPAAAGHVAEFVVPPRLLEAGWNAITIAAQHRHRVDCSLAASYELWTEIDPARTGLVQSGDARQIAGIADLPALPLRRDGALHLRIVTTERLASHEVELSLKAAQTVALAARSAFPIVDYGAPLAADGVNLRVETGSAASPTDGRSPGRGPTIDQRPGASTVTLTFGEEMLGADGASPQPAKGSPEGLRLAAIADPVSGDVEIPLVGDQPLTFGAGRRIASWPIVMPRDFYPADYDRAVLRLSGEWSPGTASGQGRLAVRANGREIASWRLPTASQSFDRQAIQIPLGNLRPGEDRLELEATLRSNDSESCAATGGERPRLRLTSRSVASVPRLARIGLFPDLAQFSAGATATPDGQPLRLVVPRPNRDSMSAAATIVTRLAVARAQVVPVTFSTAAIPAGDEHAVIVAPADAISPELLTVVGLDAGGIADGWSDNLTRQATIGSPNAPSTADDGPAECTRQTQTADSEPMVTSGGTPPVRRGRSGALDHGLSTVRSALTTGLRRLGLNSALGAPGPNERAVLAQGMAGSGARVTVLTGRTSTDVRVAASCLAGPALWGRLSGQASFVQDGGSRLRNVGATDPAFIGSQAASLANLRLVSAGWLSTHPSAVAVMTLAIMAMLSASTFHLVRRVGRSKS